MINPGVITIYRARLIKERGDGLILLQPENTLDKIVCPKDEVFDTLDDARNAIKKRKAAYEHYATFDIREVI
ncbi:MAG: hypothetical protein M5U10_06735 [Candidatus Methanoperedens sp.]|nr:hypothetical protein [Candidatus Methanoperedens sp.]